MNQFTQRLTLLMTAAALGFAPLPVAASGHGAKKPAHEAKKKEVGHGKEAKKEKQSGHGKKEAKPGGHGAAKAETKPAEPAGPSEVEKLLALISGKERKHDPQLYSEVELGDFRVSRPGEVNDDILVLKFQIYGVLNETDIPKFDHALEGRGQRMRDAVLSVVHRTSYEQLMDPSLDLVKSDLVAAINRVLENDLLRDVAFSTFSMEPN